MATAHLHDDLDSWGSAQSQASGFDITAVIGHVTFGDGDEHPHVAAFRIIGEHTRHGAAGSYRFPAEDGSTCIVDVDFATEPRS